MNVIKTILLYEFWYTCILLCVKLEPKSFFTVDLIPEKHSSCLFTTEVKMFENALYCAVAVRDNYTLCDCCKYVKYCVFSVYDFVYTCVNTVISLVQFVYVLWWYCINPRHICDVWYFIFMCGKSFFVKWNKRLQMMDRGWIILEKIKVN